MIRALAFLIAVALLQVAAFAQSNPGANSSRAGDAAEAVAKRAASAFEALDPESEAARKDEATAAYAGLPPLLAYEATLEMAPVMATATAPETATATATVTARATEMSPAPRGPAMRMIAREVVQPVPAPAPATMPVAVPVAMPVAAKPPVALAIRDAFVIKSILPIEGTIRYGDWFWDEGAAPGQGRLVITVDLGARVISAFRDGHEIGTAVVLVGTQDHPTPLGSFPILTKERDNVSEKYNNAPMPWTLRLTRDGIAIHGSPVMNGYASHGCIGVPDEFAAKLFAATKRGDTVIITRGRMIGLGDKVL